MYEKFGQFIDGKWSSSSNKETYEVINPATEEVLGQASKATPDDVEKVHEYMFELLGKAGCYNIDGVYYSASSLRSDQFAKPNTGMFKQAQQDMKYLNFKQGYFVGDKISDLKAAFKVGARPILVKTGYGEETLKELNKFSNQKIKKKTIIFDTLEDFANWMEKK